MSEQTTTSNIAKPAMPVLARRSFFSLRKFLLATAMLLCLAAGMLATGMAIFTGYVLLASEKTPKAADAIVVVTGGAGRLNRAISLFNDGLGKKLLISGVHPGYSSRTLKVRFNLTAEQIACCVDLDSQALNTVANATQTALWARQHSFDSLIIVTSTYHMPRTMLEMRRAAPEIDFQGHLVAKPGDRSVLSRLLDWNNMQLLTKEYGKLLASIIHGTSERLSRKKGQSEQVSVTQLSAGQPPGYGQ